MPDSSLTRRQRFVAHISISRSQIRAQTAYRGDFLFGLIALLLHVYLLGVVWTAVFPTSGAASASGGRQIAISTQITYATFAAIQYWLLNSGRVSLVSDRVRDGTVAVDLARPIKFPAQVISAQVGTTLAAAPFLIIAVPYAILFGGVRAPTSVENGVGYVLSLILSCLITLLMSSIVSMTAFWTLEVSGIFVIYQMISQFMSGALVPLWFMPGWLARIAELLPFQATTYTPVIIYLGQAGGRRQVLTLIGVQCVWALIIWTLLQLVWSRALRRVVVQGG
ncbi:ABC transporter permease [Streptomyces sp. NPDC058319]|uniref:ABC transporter permease n=1 Tax=unclassified Streptomyces TaxID=2593676 RepID=UPI0036DFB7AC